jgi:ABC-type glycerol-3-phosphate transport system substrate-binding protein
MRGGMTICRHILWTLALVLVSAFALAACGSGESDEDKIEGAIETAATSTDPAVCEETQTVSFMEQSSGKEGREAVEDCEEEAENEDESAESVDVSEVEIEGEEATATAAFSGGNLDGQSIVVGLVEEEGDWKLDEAVEFAKFDPEKLMAKLVAATEEALEANENATPELTECVIAGLEEISPSELEAGFLEGPKEIEETAEEVTEECVE